MTVFDTVRSLTSFRDCRDETLPRKVMGKILEAGRQAPSPGNVQSLEFIVVEDDDRKDILRKETGDERVGKAPTAVIVVADLERMRRRVGQNYEELCSSEAACAVQNMRLQAAEEDIGSCWISGFNRDVVAREFEIPDGKVAEGIVIFGYSDSPVPKDDKFPLRSICFYDYYDNQIESVFDNLQWKGLRDEKKIFGKAKEGLKDKIARKVREVL